MSHFTNIQTCFKNLFYLEKALNKLKLPTLKNLQANNKTSLTLSSNLKNKIKLNWNNEAFLLNLDSDYWNQKYSVNQFLGRLTKEYATETIVGESQKHGFETTKIKENKDGSRTISLQRYSLN